MENGKSCIFAKNIDMALPEKIFKRKIYEKVLAWMRERNGETAIMINGARRIGKSTSQ